MSPKKLSLFSSLVFSNVATQNYPAFSEYMLYAAFLSQTANFPSQEILKKSIKHCFPSRTFDSVNVYRTILFLYLILSSAQTHAIALPFVRIDISATGSQNSHRGNNPLNFQRSRAFNRSLNWFILLCGTSKERIEFKFVQLFRLSSFTNNYVPSN